MVQKGVDVGCQTDPWEDTHMEKYRKMKRKLVEFIAKQKEAKVALDKANQKIQHLLEKKRSQKTEWHDPMDVSIEEEEEEVVEGEYASDLEEDELEETPPPKKMRVVRKRQVIIPRDRDGQIRLPFQIASLNIISLGQVEYDRPNFHNERYIFPIGYTAERTYMSMVEPNNQTIYTCRVEDGGDGPLFTLQAADCPDEKISARTATRVWGSVLRKANEVRQKETSNAISGPEYYGFSHPLVIKMIEEMEGVDKCVRYIRRSRE
ncbi:Transforming growth factor beta regulator 1 [Choanephora cucurbitarum]|uniref:Transforming growth factor beta regulator 1 n=1 Tax=Choanephora cucurbitarum TaxID=101091 RepID=A0A1C7NJF9_9FUNG|nr:Transforming growth factor beta regulator 1 [Choanephora cucurbitarum]